MNGNDVADFPLTSDGAMIRQSTAKQHVALNQIPD